MRRIAVIGSGISGLLTAHGLLRAGHAVTVFTDRTADQWLHGRPTGTAARFASALAYERALELDDWHADAPAIVGAHLLYCPTPGNVLATLTGRQSTPGLAIDVRLQSHRWMQQLTARGGRLEIEAVTVARLDEIAAAHDLTVVAAGGRELTALFARDEARSGHREPQRSVAMVTVHGPSLLRDDVPFVAVKNNILEGAGEAVWIPYYHRDVGPCWNLIFEARPGGPMDRFMGARTGAEALDLARRVIADLTPWDAAWARDMVLADEQGWLVGRITPTVRRPVARLPSGRVVTCVGDTAIHFDPLAAQGANNGTRMARHLTAAVAARGDLPLDEAWMHATFESFWAREGQPAYALTNLMLAPMSAAGRLVLVAQYGSDGARKDGCQSLADAFADAFADPAGILGPLTDSAAARRYIADKSGQSWLRRLLAGGLGIARAQLRQRLGLAPLHPPERLQRAAGA